MKIMQKKLSKSLLVSVLALILVGSAAAAFVWISNIRTTTVTVNAIPITLTGDFVASPDPFVPTLQQFNFTVNDLSEKSGYVYIQFIAPGQTLNAERDIAVSVLVGWELGSISLEIAEGYPTNGWSTDQLTFVFDYFDGPLDFTWGGSNSGTIYVTTTYNIAYTMEASIRITSTSS